MSIRSLVHAGTKVWLDSIDPDEIRRNRAWGVTGATSNPVIISELIAARKFDDDLRALMHNGHDDVSVAWELNDRMVSAAQDAFRPVYQATRGDDGYVSFELDPLLEDPARGMPAADRTTRYVDLARQWARNDDNRMIKVPATPAGIAALEPIAAMGVTINVTLLFTLRQYRAARAALWRGAQRRPGGLARFKSVYSIFVSRVDVYTAKQLPNLGPAQGWVGIANAQEVWRDNAAFWADHPTPLRQEIIFASTGVKNPGDPPDKYVRALAGSDIQTNPPETNEAIERSTEPYYRTVDQLPPADILELIAGQVDQQQLEDVLMREGVAKFAKPQQELIALIARKRSELVPA